MVSNDPSHITSTYTVSSYRGKPTLHIDEVPVAAYSYSYCGAMEWPGAREIHQKFAAHGCHFYLLCVRGGFEGDWSTTPFWTDEDVYPDITGAEAEAISVCETARIILELDPDARFWVRCNASPPKRWIEKHPEQMLLNFYGKRYDEPSLASDLYNTGVGLFVENLVRFCERQPWADRLAGYLAYPIGEGTTRLTNEGHLFDQSPAMQAGFRGFLARTYGSDAALQAAWGRSDITLDTVTVPSDEDFYARGKTRFGGVETDGLKVDRIPHRLHWPEPAEIVDAKDYCRYMRELTARNFQTLMSAVKRVAPNKVAGLDAFKQTILGWPLVARWVGDYQTHGGAMHGVSGAFAMAELLDMPELDVVCTPHDYLNRGMGFGYEGEGIGDSITLRGKMMLMEEDQRSFSNSEGETWNYLKDLKEAHAGLWRNFGASISRGYNTYPMDVCNASYFMDDGIQAILAGRKRAYDAAIHWEHRDVPSIVMVVDDTSVIEEDATLPYQYLSVIHQRMYGLSRCGVPFRLHLFEDLERDDFPGCHKVFLFPNLFKVTPERLAVLREKVLCNGHVAIFGPATGITDGTKLSADLASEVTGIPLTLIRKESPRFVTVDRFDHPITAALRERVDYGDFYPYGPLLVPQEHPEVMRLGGIQWPSAKDGAGLALRSFADYTSIFTAAMPLPARLLREIARFSGTHVYGEGDDLLFADNSTLTVHSMTPGTRTIRLPQPSTVWDVTTWEKVGDNMSTLEITVYPPQTRTFYLGETM
ncbi:MAG: hypothetical protein ACYDBB_11770 [Armatimonadota bacterium]